MAQRVFVKVIGFADVERHALNSLFRLSEERGTVPYSLWDAAAPERPRLALVDGDSYEARLEAAGPVDPDLKLIWVGNAPPLYAWRTYERPISWPEVVRAMDELFAPVEEVDFDFDLGAEAPAEGQDAQDTVPPADDGAARPPRALIVSRDRDMRLYLRAKLALAHMPFADDAETGAQALESARDNDYAVALVDFDLPDFDGWNFLGELGQLKRYIPHVVVTKRKPTWRERMRARSEGLSGFFSNPPHPGKLHEVLRSVKA